MSLYKICHKKLKYFSYSENTINSYLYFISDFDSKIDKHYTRINAKETPI